MKRAGYSLLILIMLITVLFANNVEANDQEKPAVITSGQCGKGYRYNVQGWVYIHIEGEPHERGYQYGYLASAEIVDALQRWSGYRIGTKFLKIFTIKTPEQWWKICRQKAMNTFLKQIPEEYIQEMKGIVDGIKARGGQIFGRNVEFEDILASQFVQEIDYIFRWTRKGFHPVRDLLSGLKEIFSGQILNHENGHCNAFIATGDATSDGGIVVSHSSIFPLYVAQRCNIILDVEPSEGYRFMMTGPPGSLWSDEDWYQNEKGIILTETELIEQGPWKTRGTTPKGVRSRRAIQYSDSIDEVIQNLKEGNNGLIPNEWLIGDTKTGEIASYMQALYNTPIKRTFDGYYWSCNLAQNVKVLGELNGVPPILLRIYSKLPSKDKIFDIDGENVIWKDDRSQKLMQLGEQYYGEIDVEIAKKIMSTSPLPRLTTDCKITNSKLMEKLGIITHMGRPNGLQINPADETKNKFHMITELPASGWLELYPFNGEVPILQSNDVFDFEEENGGRLLWQYETENTGNRNYSSSIVSEDIIYIATSPGNIYALNKANGREIWNENVGYNSLEFAIAKNLLFVSTNKGLHALEKDTGRVEWEKSIGKMSSKPIISENQVIAGCLNGDLYAFDIDTGEEKWTYKFDDAVYVSNVKHDKIYIGSGDVCYAFDIANTELIWGYETKGPITASPKIHDETVYFGSWDGNIYALYCKTGNLRWKYQTGWGIDSTPDISDGTIFVGSLDNTFYAINEKDGKLKWFFTCKSAIHSNPVAYGDLVFFGCDDGKLYALNKGDGGVTWSFAPGYFLTDDNSNNYVVTPIVSNPVVKEGVVFFSAKGTVYAIDAQTLEIAKKEKTEAEDYIIYLLIGLIIVIIVALLIIYKQKIVEIIR